MTNYLGQGTAQSAQACSPIVSPEQRIANALREDLGVCVNAQALRIFIRTRWELLNRAAHEIHRGE